ncbi:intraflagellar transport protein 43 homolog isoform X2 [Venturia canescens]|uniref:intraflagellar transport protein 43 homolog isoform X2 n=1 Tax=Venturia canescens TaxID=32260 RepID=UPI001C9D5C53|nr:intraflagellar transport protein 43 homolog isoform X2 [Venturia canescens]
MDWGSDLEVASKKVKFRIRSSILSFHFSTNACILLIPRLGRRAGQSNATEEGKSDDDMLDSPGSFASAKSAKPVAPVAPPRTRKTGWGDEFKGNKVKVSNIIEQLFLRERFRATENEEPDDEIPIIPDLDEIQADNGIPEIANAPSVGVNRVAAYKELDKDLLKNEAFAYLDGIDLSLLTDRLYPEKLVREPDEMWSWDVLFTQISSELNSEAQSNLDS